MDEAALAELRALLGTASRARDRLIENLHLLQDRYGHLAARPERGGVEPDVFRHAAIPIGVMLGSAQIAARTLTSTDFGSRSESSTPIS